MEYLSLLLAIGLILGVIKKGKDKATRESYIIMILIVSIPIIVVLFPKDSEVITWFIPVIIMISSLLFTNSTLLITLTIVAMGTQIRMWIIKPHSYVLVNEFDYMVRMVIILSVFFIGSYINRIYISKMKEKNYKIAFQKMVLDISFEFMSINQENFDEKVNKLLGNIGSFFNVDRTYLFTINHNNGTMTYSNEWCNIGISPEVGTIEEIPIEVFPWWIDQLNKNNLVYVEDVNVMPAEASAEQDQLYRQDVKSLISVPIIVEGRIQAFIGIDSVTSTKRWTEENIELLYIMAKILSSGITHINYHKKIDFMAYHDPLTGLPNRLLLTDRVNQGILRASRQETLISIMFIDLDEFKMINDTLGHDQGDELLKQISRRMLSIVRKDDTVCRLGGDEFVLYLNNYKNEHNLDIIASKVIDIFNKPFILRGQEYFITGSVGISQYPKDGEDVEALIKSADIGMYKAKDLGKNQYHKF